jgi:hypothetical protein
VERRDGLEVESNVLRDAGGARKNVAPQGFSAAHAVLLVDHVQAVDAVHIVKALRQEVDCAARGHDLDGVSTSKQVLKNDARPHCVAHAFANDTVEDLHVAPSPGITRAQLA